MAAERQQQDIFRNGDLVINRTTEEVLMRSRQIHLSPSEYGVLLCLANHVGWLVSYNQIMNEAIGHPISRVTLSHNVSMITTRMGDQRDNHQLIFSQPNVGYIMLEVVEKD